MAIPETDIKKLWGAAAGICSKPGCHEDLLPILNKTGTTIIGEMAHVIARKKTGPRAKGTEGEDTYENLILLCPTHHELVDKAPDDFPEGLLFQWKRDHEAQRGNLTKHRFASLPELAREISSLLKHNHQVWIEFGPESKTAKANPFSTAAVQWDWFKIGRIVPNNERIASLLEEHQDLLSPSQKETVNLFLVHARAFSRSAYARQDRDAVPRFPIAFQQLIEELSK